MRRKSKKLNAEENDDRKGRREYETRDQIFSLGKENSEYKQNIANMPEIYWTDLENGTERYSKNKKVMVI